MNVDKIRAGSIIKAWYLDFAGLHQLVATVVAMCASDDGELIILDTVELGEIAVQHDRIELVVR